MTYFDHAATSLPKPQPVVDAVAQAMGSLGNAARGVHAGSLSAARTIYEAREKLAAFFGCPRPDHVVFTCNATEALNITLSGLLSPGDHAIATDYDHNSVLRPLYRLERERGVSLSFLPADRRGRLDYTALEGLLQPRTRLLVCTHASNLTGDLVDIAALGRFAKAHGLLFVLDAAQTAGVFPIHMGRLGLDVVCFTGHKSLMGPQGTGGLCVGEGVDIRPWKVGGTGVQTFSPHQPENYPTRLEAGTLNGHGIAGLSAALDYIQAMGLDAIRRREMALMERFYQGVRDIPGIRVYGDFTRERSAIVALNLGEDDSAAVADALAQDYGIAVRSGGHCAPRLHRALGTQAQGAVRFSFSWQNTEPEVDTAVRALAELCP